MKDGKKNIEILSGDQAKQAEAAAVAEQPAAEDSAAAEPAAREPADASGNARQPDTDDPAELKKLLAEKSAALAESEKKGSEYLEHLQRMKAEFENFRRRVEREKLDTAKYANEKLFHRIVPVFDNLRRGGEYAANNAKDEEIIKGIQLVEKQFGDTLAEFGVKPYECKGKPFDPNIHEPLYTVETADVDDNTVVDEVERGYMLHEKVLRVAKVAISRKPAPAEEPAQE